MTGEETAPGRWWERALASLTLDEWTLLFVYLFWLWLGLLATRELRPDWRKPLGGYTACSGAVVALLAACVAMAVSQQTGRAPGVVVAPEAVIRYGPLEESPVFFQLKDGMEVTVLDEQPGPLSWLLVKDATGREGWLKRDEVCVLTRSPFRPADS